MISTKKINRVTRPIAPHPTLPFICGADFKVRRHFFRTSFGHFLGALATTHMYTTADGHIVREQFLADFEQFFCALHMRASGSHGGRDVTSSYTLNTQVSNLIKHVQRNIQFFPEIFRSRQQTGEYFSVIV